MENVEERKVLILQPHLINNLIEKFGEEVSHKRVYGTPGTPRFKVTRPDKDSDSIDEKSSEKISFRCWNAFIFD